MRRNLILMVSVATLVTAAALAGPASATGGGVTFTTFPLVVDGGGSEPAVSIAPSGKVFLDALSWRDFQTNVWKGKFGATPAFQGPIDASIGKGIGGGDADIDVGSTGTLHFTSLMFFFNPTANALQLGVSAVTCPNGDTSGAFANCTKQIIDTTQADRQWITSDGSHVWISYHDSGSSTLIHVQRSDDDGFTWKQVGDPIVGQDGVTGDSTFNNDQGPIVADPTTHFVYDVFAAGEAGLQKGTSADFNNIFVSRSKNLGVTWKAVQVFHAPVFTALNNVFPSLAVDPVNGDLYATWSDGNTVSLSKSTDHGSTWTSPKVLNSGSAATALFPWVAARGGTVDVVYYGTTAPSKDDPTAVWNTFMARSTNGGSTWTQSLVSPHPNHVGVICTQGIACAAGTRNLLDLFEVAISPVNGRATVIYTDDTLSTDANGNPLPQAVVAYQN
ncbi:MAG: exo-alpha-sialidase [Actinobacteria bacterium]|nr:exo-alpha-sialidase [Actinomycetota bacterium]